MHAFSILPARAMMLIGLGLILAMATGCPDKKGDEVECDVAADCEGEGEWICTDEGVCEAVEVDLCKDVECPGVQTCDTDTGDCVGTCCDPSVCVMEPGTICVEEDCLAGDPCQPRECDPPCEPGELCDEETWECVVECKIIGCPEPNQRCEDDGSCVERAPEFGEIGWPCGDDDDPASHDNCTDGNHCGYWGTCTKGCIEHEDCGAGAFCLQDVYGDGTGRGYCWAACDDFLGEDCADGTQCVSFSDLEYPGCYIYFEVSGCEEDCVPRGRLCDPGEANQCEAGLACVDIWDGDMGVCQEIQCGLPYGSCSAPDEMCYSLGAGLSVCIDNCDLADVDYCPEGMACQPNPIIESIFDKWRIADATEGCPDAYPRSHPAGAELICYEGCDDNDDCPAGTFCQETVFFTGLPAISGCVSYAVETDGCDACDAMGADCVESTFESTQGPLVAGVCHLACETSADCVDEGELMGNCETLTFTSGDSISICVYGSQGAFCLEACDNDGHCGYCNTNDDCPYFSDNRGFSVPMRCDVPNNVCKKPADTVTAPDRCDPMESLDPQGIERVDGTTESACATPCENDDDCFGGVCNERNFCDPFPEHCNLISGQCEPPCVDDDTCIHATCIDGVCMVGCEEHGDCGSEAVCYFDEPNYCVFPECVEHDDCTEEGWICIDGFCVEGEVVEPECEGHEDCTEEGAEYCDTEAGLCVECTNQLHCAIGSTCQDGSCVEIVD